MISTVIVRKREEKRLLSGHQWLFSNEIGSISGPVTTGDVVNVARHDGAILGRGFYHAHSLIAVRLLTRQDEEIDRGFFERRIAAALKLRASTGDRRDAFRAVHGESDLLPGLIIDVYGPAVVVQTLSAGMDLRLETIAAVIRDLLSPTTIVARNDSPLRTLEGLPVDVRVLHGEPGTVDIEEHGLTYSVDVIGGHKTGLFLDQADNRLAIRRYMKGRNVLDCFCHAGGFGFNAFRGEATSVSFLDISPEAIASLQRHADGNRIAIEATVCGDAFDLLADAAGQRRTYGAIILDPPAFTRNRKTVATALKGYRRLNMLAMQLLQPGGILVTASCSHHIDRQQFSEMVHTSALRVGKTLRVLESRGASADHPVLVEMPETEYLKLLVCVVD